MTLKNEGKKKTFMNFIGTWGPKVWIFFLEKFRFPNKKGWFLKEVSAFRVGDPTPTPDG